MDRVIADWHIDRRITGALALVFLLQFGATVYWSASLAAQVETNETNISTNVRHVEGLTAGQREIAETLSTISAQMSFLLSQYSQLARRLDAGAAGYGGGR